LPPFPTRRSSDLHEAEMLGTVRAPAVSSEPLSVTRGRFNLFVDDPNHVMTKQMRYRMSMRSEEGHDYHFERFKVIHHDKSLDVWPDTTTLYVTIRDGAEESGPILAQDILRITPADFLRQLSTTKATNASSAEK